jgi:hypothetical protein
MPKAPTMPKEFAEMKKLVGTWEGTADMGTGKPEPVKVIYELTSGGTAITEKLMPGTPHEMTTIYYSDGKSLAMTHYCATGNHPEMKLKKANTKGLEFEMTAPTGVASMNEMHMHALKLTLSDANTLKQEWTNFTDGKKAEVAVFNFKRKM